MSGAIENLKILDGVVDIVQLDEFKNKLKQKKRLRIKTGFDPSQPDLHLGHLILLKKLRWFQDQNHQVIFVVGDFTAQIGDPSGANKTRPLLSSKEVKQNAKTYARQAYKILDKRKTKLVYNSKWFSSMKPGDFIKLASSLTVARMLERNDFSMRFKDQKPISIHEFLYPLFQGYDSLKLEADVELGGTDQLFNLLVGRDIQKQNQQEPQCVLTFPVIEGISGVQKMSKSYGNAILFNDVPKDIFGKTMKISDELMLNYYKVFLDCLTSSEADKAFKQKSQDVLNFFDELKKYSKSNLPKIDQLSTPLNKFIKEASSNQSLKDILLGKMKEKSLKILKENLAFYFVETLYNESQAHQAQKEFNAIFKQHLIPQSLKEVRISEIQNLALTSLMKQAGLSSSSGEARRFIEGGGVKLLEGKKISDEKLKKYIGQKIIEPQLKINLVKGDEFILSVGKRKQIKIRV